ncbi:PilZ domain-containing protein [Corallococcus sp. AB049A]|uniref:PilZ domain-containing protein n=2 Tax=Myxococcaceae TaxID=31 RepID=A0A3A8QXS1_9BACT|nr:PilZ domain-containing protein [Corallococcus interemptor]RKI66655.1 PilZ domain-containing protein [Corallococcus sp. AB049A]
MGRALLSGKFLNVSQALHPGSACPPAFYWRNFTLQTESARLQGMHLPRAVPRFEHRLAVRLRGMLPLYTRDVSESGFCAEMLQPMKAGDLVEGALLLGDEEVPFQARVMWARRSAGERTRGRCGVRFVTIGEDFQRRLVAFRRLQGRRLVRWFT